MKRFVLAFIGLIVIGALGLLIWPPAPLQQWILAELSKRTAKETPYEFTADRLSGNLLTGVVLNNVQVFQKSGHTEIFRTPRLAIQLNLWRFITKRIVQIDNLSLEAGGGQVTATGHFATSPQPAGVFHIEDQNVALEKIPSSAAALSSSLHLQHTGTWDVTLDSQVWTVDMTGRLCDAPIRLQGNWGPSTFYRMQGSWEGAHLHTVWQDPELKGVKLSAGFKLFGRGAAVNGTANLMGQDVMNSAHRQVRGTAEFKDGVGDFHFIVGLYGTRATVHGTVQIPSSSLQATLEANHILWEKRLVEKLSLTVDAHKNEWRARASLQNLQWREGISSPGDVKSTTVSIRGKSPHWLSEISTQFGNGSIVQVSGRADQSDSVWVFVWKKLSVSLPNKGVWTAKPEGSVVWRPGKETRLRRLVVQNGGQKIEIPAASFSKDAVQADIEVRALDPGPLLAFADPDVSAAGTVNASFHVRMTAGSNGRFSQPTIEGYINAKFEKLSMDSIGLLLKDIDIDLRSSDQWVEVRRFIAKSKKGEVQITGRSRLPDLDFTLRAHEFALQAKNRFKAIADAQIHLSGNWNAPSVEGQLTLQEATYTLPTKKEKNAANPAQKKTASPPSSPTGDSFWRRMALDLHGNWARNVWYRDGVTGIETNADLRVQKDRESMIVRWTGSIRSIRGSYNYFGRDFTIESGQIQFTGTPELNPLLNIEASYRRDPTVVYLDISGTADKPALKLHSSPPLSDQDIMSVIVFGQPLNELRAKSGGQSSNQAAMQAAGGVLGSYLSKSLRQTGLKELDIDVLNIEPTQEGSQLTVGRYLTRKLFVSYGQAVRGSAEKTITADYFLTDKWTLQGASDSLQGNYMDVLFRYPLNKTDSPINATSLPVSPFRKTLDQLLPNQPRAPGSP